MSLCWKLDWSYVQYHPLRMVLAGLAIVASAGMVIWVVSRYDALMAQLAHQTPQYLGRYDFSSRRKIPMPVFCRQNWSNHCGKTRT